MSSNFELLKKKKGGAAQAKKKEVSKEQRAMGKLKETSGLENQKKLVSPNKVAATPQPEVAPVKAAAKISHDVDKTVTQTIEAPPAYAAWSGTYSWDTKFGMEIDPAAKAITVVMKLFTSASDAVKKKWEEACEGKWSNKFAVEVTKDGVKEKYPIIVDLVWVDKAKDAHHTVKANDPSAKSGGRSGQGGTTSMTGWGVNDKVDVTHEFGHMLGNTDEYFKTNGVDYKGFRHKDGSAMNNPANDPVDRHFELIRKEFVKAMKLTGASTKVVAK